VLCLGEELDRWVHDGSVRKGCSRRIAAEGLLRRARLLVVDDHAFMRADIKAIVGMDGALEVVGEAQDGQEALALCRELGPDLILMDVSMPRMDGIEATRKIKAEFPLTSVLILTAHADHRLLTDAVKAGAAGYVLKGEHPDHLLDAVRAVRRGETPLDQGLVLQLIRGLLREDASREKTPTRASPELLRNTLSSQEIEVLRLIASGKTNRQIAQELAISLSSVKTYVQRIIKKLGVSDRTQACVRAIELGLLPDQQEGQQ
jgi:DNA-binding NarL/FixJ family response regulator